VSGHSCLERLLMPEALSGRLEPAEEKRVMAHLETCPACQDVAADIEIALISLAVLKDEQQPVLDLRDGAAPSDVDPLLLAQLGQPAAAPAANATASETDPSETAAVVPLARRRTPAPVRWLAIAASGAILLGGGLLVGRQVLPPRDTVSYGPPVALAPPSTASAQAARGTASIGREGAALAVKLNASSLPSVGWYECLWVAGGETRSAGSFRVTNGVVKDVELMVAQPQDAQGWDLQIVQHQGTTARVVLEGQVTPS
jgi:anti-sigma factor RsiW